MKTASDCSNSSWSAAAIARCWSWPRCLPKTSWTHRARAPSRPWRAAGPTQPLALRGLAEPEALRLARELVAEETSPALLEQMVVESRGHPLFLRELVERMRAGTHSIGSLTLDEALRARVDSLVPEARNLLVLTALAEKPCRPELLARALGCQELPRDTVITLLEQGFLRRRRDGELKCFFHDRLRQAALAWPTPIAAASSQAAWPQRSKEPHGRSRRARTPVGDRRRIALAPPPPARWRAIRALEGLSFGWAEQRYQHALQLIGERPTDDTWLRLTTQLGHALVRLRGARLPRQPWSSSAPRKPPRASCAFACACGKRSS